MDDSKAPRMWGPRDDIPAIAQRARLAAAGVLAQLAVLRPPPGQPGQHAAEAGEAGEAVAKGGGSRGNGCKGAGKVRPGIAVLWSLFPGRRGRSTGKEPSWISCKTSEVFLCV